MSVLLYHQSFLVYKMHLFYHPLQHATPIGKHEAWQLPLDIEGRSQDLIPKSRIATYVVDHQYNFYIWEQILLIFIPLFFIRDLIPSYCLAKNEIKFEFRSAPIFSIQNKNFCT